MFQAIQVINNFAVERLMESSSLGLKMGAGIVHELSESMDLALTGECSCES
jgi:hypothetical protein